MDNNLLTLMINDYNSGMSISQIGARYNLSSATVNYHLKKNIQIRKPGGKLTFNFEEAKRLHLEGKTLQQIADVMKVNRTAIYEQFKKHGVNTTNRQHINYNDVFSLLENGLSDDQISSSLGCSVGQIQTFRRSLGRYANNYHGLKEFKEDIKEFKGTFAEAIDKWGHQFSYSTILNNYMIFVRSDCPTIGKNKQEKHQLIIDKNQQLIYDMIADDRSINEICNKLCIPRSSIQTWIQRHNIEYKSPKHRISTQWYRLLTNYEFMLNLSNDPFTTVRNVAEKYFNNEIGVDIINVYAERLGINISQKPLVERFPVLLDKDYLQQQYTVKSCADIADIIGVSHPTIRKMLQFHGIEIKRDHLVSKFEKQVLAHIRNVYAGEIIENDRTIIAPKEVDILIPDLKLAIECCGIYWHSEKYKPNNYHKEKMESVNAAGYQLITIFEDEWMFKQDIVCKKLNHLLGVAEDRVFARKCKTVNVSYLDARDFCELTHIQGATNTSINLGLEFDGELVALMCFKKLGESYQLSRFCTSINVVGGFSKLLKYFKHLYSNAIIETFADLRWSNINDNVYLKNGFKMVHIIPPTYFYYDYISKQLLHRSLFTREKLAAKLKDKFDPYLTERQNANNAGYFAVYNCGLVKYVLKDV